MGSCFLYGQTGGGAGFNLKLVSGASAPDTAGENDLWVQTNTPVTDYVFSPVQPESAEEGVVWLRTGGEGVNFILDKKQNLRFFIKTAYQYVDGAWLSVDVSVYSGTGWEKLASSRLYLFDNGDVCTDVTGGWTIKNYGDSRSNSHFEPDSIYIGPLNNTDLAASSSWVYTNNRIAIPDWVKCVYMRVDIRQIGDGVTWGFEAYHSGTSQSFVAYGRIDSNTGTGEHTLCIDISQLRGMEAYSFGIYTWMCNYSVFEIWMGE